MPPIQRVLETALYVDDLDRSAKFYLDIFGFREVSNSERLKALSVRDNQLLLLFKKKLSARLPATPHDGDGQLHLAFAIAAEDLPAWEQWLEHHQIPVEEKTHWERGGVSLYFRDPDRHLLEVATPGVWSIY